MNKPERNNGIRGKQRRVPREVVCKAILDNKQADQPKPVVAVFQGLHIQPATGYQYWKEAHGNAPLSAPLIAAPVGLLPKRTYAGRVHVQLGIKILRVAGFNETMRLWYRKGKPGEQISEDCLVITTTKPEKGK